jgi:predicted RNA methylase
VKTTLDHVRLWLDRLYIAADGAGLRDEDHKKAFEVSALLDDVARVASGRNLTIVDAAAGKGYTGLLAAKLVLGPFARVVAIERDPRRLESVRAAFAALQLPDVTLDLRAADVADPAAWPDAPDLVVALHACGAATDHALDRAVAARAERIWSVPCCYDKTLRGDELARGLAHLIGVPPQYGPLRRRFVHSIVDIERVLRLEAAGYATEVVEIVSPTVTPHNMMFRATRAGPQSRRAAEASDKLESLRRAGRRGRPGD